MKHLIERKNLLLFIVVGLALYLLHISALIMFGLPIWRIGAYYIYFLFAALAVHATINFYFKKNPERVGLMFLVSIMVKMILFTAVFSMWLFAGKPLELVDRLNILIPFLTFLILEVVSIMNVLNKNT